MLRDRAVRAGHAVGILGHASSATTLDLYSTQSIDDVQAHYQRINGSILGVIAPGVQVAGAAEGRPSLSTQDRDELSSRLV